MATSPSLNEFEVETCLRESDVSKTVVLLGRFKDKEGRGIVILSRRHLPVSTEKCQTLMDNLRAEQTFNNDIYSKFAGALPEEHNLINIDIIYPCTEKHVQKHSKQQVLMIEETQELYATVTKPHIDSIPVSNIQWVYNMLEKKKEADRLIFEDPDPLNGFMLHPDLKWDQSQTEKLYCIALINRRDIRSIRELRGEHLPLLENIKSKGEVALRDKYGIKPSELRMCVHYFPSYYHLHVHFMHIALEPTYGMVVGKAVLLTDVISNISMMSEYYEKATLGCVIGTEDPLCKKLCSHNDGDKVNMNKK